MLILISIVLVTIFISANCSLYEAVLYSTRRGTLESAKNHAKKGRLATLMIEMKNNISKPIAAILILNTIANTAGATIAGMYASDILGKSWVIVFSILFTISILFLAEILPKTIGAVHWKGLWAFVVYPLSFMRSILSPLIFVTEKFTRMFTKKRELSTITEDEILALIHLGAREGEISQEESRIIKNIIDLEEKTVEDILTPRKMIFSLDQNMKIGETWQAIHKSGLSRILIYENDKENIKGYVLAKDVFYLNLINKGDELLKSIVLEVDAFEENINCLILLNKFLKSKNHIAIIKDEYDGLSGLVTLEDLIETGLGVEIVDEKDTIIDMQQAARKSQPKK